MYLYDCCTVADISIKKFFEIMERTSIEIFVSAFPASRQGMLDGQSELVRVVK